MLKVKRQAPKKVSHLSLALIVMMFSLTACTEDEAKEREIIRPVRYFEVPSAGQFAEGSFPGRAKATQEVDLAFRVSGPLISFPVEVGDEVKKDEIVARIDPRDFEVNVNSAQGRLNNARAAFERAQNEYTRELNILDEDPGATSQTAVDRKKEARDKARANIQSFAADLEGAKDRLAYTYLKAPFDGNVVKTYVENFENVQAKQSIVRILDDSSIEMVVNVPESLISIAPHAQNITVVFDPFPNTRIPAKIKEIGTEASATTRTYPVTLIMQQPENVKILPGMAGKATGTIPPDISSNGLAIEIPMTSIFTDEASGNTFVWLIDQTDLTVSKKQIIVDKVGDHGMRVLSGINRGDYIASAGVHYLFEGQKVKLLENFSE